MPETVDILLERWRQGDAEAGEQFIGQVYSELRRLAAYYFSGERSGHTLQPTAIVNELYLKMFSETPVEWKDRAHFFSVASRHSHRPCPAAERPETEGHPGSDPGVGKTGRRASSARESAGG